MKEADIQKALDRAESLLKDADGKMFMVSADTATVEGLDAIREDLGDAQHSVNNARQVLLSLRLLLEMEKGEAKAEASLGKVLTNVKSALRGTDPHSIPSESVEPPEPDLNADGPGERFDRVLGYWRSK